MQRQLGRLTGQRKRTGTTGLGHRIHLAEFLPTNHFTRGHTLLAIVDLGHALQVSAVTASCIVASSFGRVKIFDKRQPGIHL